MLRPYGVGCLIVRAQPANVAVAFFFGALGVEGDETFENNVVEGLPLIPNPSPQGLPCTHKLREPYFTGVVADRSKDADGVF
jgi:hypothetical protein